MLGTPADYCEKDAGEDDADDYREEKAFEPVASPGAPGLNRNAIVFAKGFVKKVERKL